MQVFNPYLPLDDYIPDGEPHVFGDRVYIYGSHDKENGEFFWKNFDGNVMKKYRQENVKGLYDEDDIQ